MQPIVILLATINQSEDQKQGHDNDHHPQDGGLDKHHYNPHQLSLNCWMFKLKSYSRKSLSVEKRHML